MKEKLKSKKVLIVAGLILLFIFIAGSGDDNTDTPSNQVSESMNVAEDIATQEPAEPQENEVPEYQISHTSDIRYDGATNYYILIPPINPTEGDYKEIVTGIIEDMKSKHGNKISLEIYDQKEIMDLEYKRMGDLSLGRVLTEQEMEERALHLIGAFDGEMDSGTYVNTIYYFPGATRDTPVVGAFVETLEYK